MRPEIPASIQPLVTFVHPTLMWVLLAVSLYALYLGVQIRRTRAAEGDQKKELIKGRFNVRHYQVGSILLALIVIGTVGGMAVTYLNNGKLFVGSHLIVGLGVAVLVASSAALSPFLQKGQVWARYTHIVLNIGLLGLFGWQAVTGVEIVQRIISEM